MLLGLAAGWGQTERLCLCQPWTETVWGISMRNFVWGGLASGNLLACENCDETAMRPFDCIKRSRVSIKAGLALSPGLSQVFRCLTEIFIFIKNLLGCFSSVFEAHTDL